MLHLAVFILCCICTVQAKTNQNLILVLIDGFSNYYLNQTGITLNGFRQLATHGVQADYLKPDFPTLSLPNYYTLVTGLHVESHGMTGNYMYDRVRNLTFYIGAGKDDYIPLWWNETLPLWITAQNQGVPTESYWWIGCEVVFKEGSMKSCHRYVSSVRTEELAAKFDGIIQNLQTKKSQAEFLYFEPVDHFGHAFGPESEIANTAVYQIDAYLQLLQTKIAQAGLWTNTNVIVVSDHGQVLFNTSDPSRVIIMDHCITDWSAILVTVDRGTFKQGIAHKLDEQFVKHEVYVNLTKCLPHQIKVYKKEDMPDRWHYKNGRFIPAIILVPDIGYTVYTKEAGKQIPVGVAAYKGMHGYDNKYHEMDAIFFARGPCFKENYRNQWMNSVDVYQIMATILGIQGHSNNGTWDTVKGMMADHCGTSDTSSSHKTQSSFTAFYICLYAILLML